MALSQEQRKKLRGIGHRLQPVVQVGSQGLTEGVVQETGRALHDHELIKVHLPAGDGKARRAMAAALCEQCKAELVQTIGRMALLYRANPEANPKLSNLKR